MICKSIVSNFVRVSLLLIVLFYNAIALAQTTYRAVQPFYGAVQDPCQNPCYWQSIVDPCTGEEIVDICVNNNLSIDAVNQESVQIPSDLIKEVMRRQIENLTHIESASFPKASSFLYNYDKILKIRELNLSDSVRNISPKRVLDIHISWLINRHIDLLYQQSTASDEKLQAKLQEEADKVIKELEYLQTHSLVEPKRQSLISDYLKKVSNKDEQAKVDKPNPEIYFIRGTVANVCCSYDDALLDYFEGFECLSRVKTKNPADYNIYFSEIRKALSNSAAISESVEKNRKSAALVCFNYGYSAFWEGRYDESAILFTGAILDNDRDPIYWYYRALAWKRLGEVCKADMDAIKGAHVEREVFGKRMPVIGVLLQRVQGEERRWLEYKRIGY